MGGGGGNWSSSLGGVSSDNREVRRARIGELPKDWGGERGGDFPLVGTLNTTTFLALFESGSGWWVVGRAGASEASNSGREEVALRFENGNSHSTYLVSSPTIVITTFRSMF